MSEFVTQLRSLIGSPPAGFEWLEYIVASFVLLFLLNACINFVSWLFKWIGSGFVD